jgi:hypothetical protein
MSIDENREINLQSNASDHCFESFGRYGLKIRIFWGAPWLLGSSECKLVMTNWRGGPDGVMDEAKKIETWYAS